ncbi:MAG: hypothetical protein Q9171_006097 [Xanthocarpia ochracea]
MYIHRYGKVATATPFVTSLYLTTVKIECLPEVILDTTLATLYKQYKPTDGTKQVALLLYAANSEIAPTSKLARNTKYLYQDSTFSTTLEDCSSEKHESIQRSVAVKYLSLVPQHDASEAGDMPVILFDLGSSETDSNHSKEEAQRIVSSLAIEQRPTLLFFSNPMKISTREQGIDLLAAKMEFDQLEDLPLALDLDTHYFLSSKAALCTSGLPRHGNMTIPSDCTGPRGQWLKTQINRLMSQITSHTLLFVVKNQQTFAGGGTFVVSSQQDLLERQDTLSNRILPKLLSQVNSSNAHLKPASLILREMIIDPIGDWGLTCFVSRSGECTFLAVTRQVVDPSKAWIGSTITYTDQDSLETRFTPIMQKIGAWLSKHGYYGPCGADILESRRGRSNGSPQFDIVDLNVRTSGSLVLGLMKGHFSKRRGLHEASSISINVEMARDAFIRTFESKFREGQMVIASWYEDLTSGVSYGNLLVGAQDRKSLQEEVARIKEIASEVSF